MTVIPEEPNQIVALRNAFAHGSKLNMPEVDVKASLIAVESEIKKRPIRKRDILPYSIGRMSTVISNAPEYLTRQEVKDQH